MPKGRVWPNGLFVADRRGRVGMSQADLATKCECSVKKISDIETGKATTRAMLERVADALQIPLERLLQPETDPPSLQDRSDKSLGLAPPAPDLFLGRGDELAHVRSRICTGKKRQPQLAKRNITIIHGWPGAGKSTLASAVVHDAAVRKTFGGNILWTSLGQRPDISSTLITWSRTLGIQPSESASTQTLSAQLNARLANVRMLIVLDDVWTAADAISLVVGGWDCAVLVTTRLPLVAAHLAASPANDIFELGGLAEHDGVSLLRELAGEDVVSAHDVSAHELVRDVEGSPLALEVCGRQLHSGAVRGRGVATFLRQLQSDTSQLLSMPLPPRLGALLNDTTATVVALLRMSTRLLDDESRACFAGLGSVIVPKPAHFDLGLMAGVWDCGLGPAERIANKLVDSGLLKFIGQGVTGRRYQMHDLLVQYAKTFFQQ